MAGRAALATTKAEVRLVRSTDSKVSSDSFRTKVPAITPGGVHEQVDPPSRRDHRRERLRVGAVTRRPARSDLRGGGFELVGGASGEHHVVPALDEHPPDRQPDPAAAPGDDRYPRAAIHGEEPKR